MIKKHKESMSRDELIKMRKLDEAAEKSGSFISSVSEKDIHYNYREINRYCKEKGIEPIDMTIRELNTFIIDTSFETLHSEERINMCEAIEGIRNDGIEIGLKKGTEEGMLKTLSALVNDGILTLSDAEKRVNMSVEEFEAKTDI